MSNLLKPNLYIYEGHNSNELRKELQKYNLDELKQIYDMVSGWKLETKERKNKELLIEKIIEATLRMCNRWWVWHPNSKDLSSPPYK